MNGYDISFRHFFRCHMKNDAFVRPDCWFNLVEHLHHPQRPQRQPPQVQKQKPWQLPCEFAARSMKPESIGLLDFWWFLAVFLHLADLTSCLDLVSIPNVQQLHLRHLLDVCNHFQPGRLLLVTQLASTIWWFSSRSESQQSTDNRWKNEGALREEWRDHVQWRPVQNCWPQPQRGLMTQWYTTP